MSSKRPVLGRGLAALIPAAGRPPAVPPAAAGTGAEAVGTAAEAARATAADSAGAQNGTARGRQTVQLLPIEEIHPGPQQPRKVFDDARLTELAESIRTQGILQPILVRPRPAGGFELIAGERRWRAAQRAGLHEVPALVRDLEDKQAFEMALVENLQRADLNPMEEAQGYERLIAEFSYTQESLAARVGKDRSTVANALRLLRLPPAVRELLDAQRLSVGHARALLGLEDAAAMETLARQTVAKSLSVRQVEALVRRARAGGDAPEPPPAPPARPSASVRDLTDRLQRALGTRVRVVEDGPGRGHLEIHYGSLDELDAVLDKILPG